MAMTVVVTRNVPERVRGFLASCMCEIGPGVYTAPRMDAAVRDRVWAVVFEWCGLRTDLAVVMTWPEPKLPGGQAVRALGVPPVELIELNGVFLARRDLTEDDVRSLTTRFGGRVATEEVPRDAATTAAETALEAVALGGTVVGNPREASSLGEAVMNAHDERSAPGGMGVGDGGDPGSAGGEVVGDVQTLAALSGVVVGAADEPPDEGGTAG